MARVALIKLFTGLNLGVSQLSGELQRAGHESRIIYLKDYIVVPKAEEHLFPKSDVCGIWVAARAQELNCNCYRPFTDREYALLMQALEEFRPDLIGFSLCSVPFREVADATLEVKKHFPDVPIIWGGSGPTLEPERALRYADLVCNGEGEGLIVDLADAIDAGRDYSATPNLCFLRNGAYVRNPNRKLVDLETIAIPDFEPSRTIYINDDRMRRNVYPPNLGRQYHIMTQRGCPFSCSFCIESWYQDEWGKKDSVRRRSVDAVIQELVEAKQRLGIQAVMFYDDVFTINPRWLREFAPRYKAEVGLPFWCYTYPTTTRKDDIAMLKDAGLASVTVGIQSGSKEVLAEYNRPVAVNTAIRAAHDIIDCGVDAFFDLLTRSDVETEKSCRETFDFLLEFPRQMKTVGFYPMTKFPDYSYTRKVNEQQRTTPLTDADYDYYHRLYLLTRTELPREVVQAFGESETIRREPQLLDPLLPERLPFFYLDNHAFDLAASFGGSDDEDDELDRRLVHAGDTPAPQYTPR